MLTQVMFRIAVKKCKDRVAVGLFENNDRAVFSPLCQEAPKKGGLKSEASWTHHGAAGNRHIRVNGVQRAQNVIIIDNL